MFDIKFYQEFFLKIKDRNKRNSELSHNISWHSKYDVSLSILKEEYYYSLKAINDVDEKASKYLIMISIALTGFFVITSSSAIDNLIFDYSKGYTVFLLSILFILLFLSNIWYGFIVFKESLKCFNLINIKKIPNIENALTETQSQTTLEYKSYLIAAYQLSINALELTLKKKQSHIKTISENINYFILSLFLSVLVLVILKILA